MLEHDDKSLELAKRRGVGTAGKPVTLRSNFFRMRIANREFHQYHVHIEPEVQGRRMRGKILRGLEQKFGVTVFDGYLLFAQEKFPDIEAVVTVEVEYKIKVVHTNVLSTQQLPPTAAQLFNILLKRCHRSLNLVPVSRNYFDPTKKVEIPQHNVEIWPGYATSIGSYQAGVLLNVDVARKVIRTQTVLNMLNELRQSKVSNLEEKANSLLQNAIVMTAYNNKTYNITRIDFTRTPRFEFTLRDGKTITVEEHLKVRYGITLRERNQPLIVSIKKKTTEEILLVPEVCRMTGLTDEMIEDFRVMKDIGEHTRVYPPQRVIDLEQYRKSLDSEPAKKVLKEWEMEIAPTMFDVPGRVLPPEVIHLNSKQQANNQDKPDWTNFVRTDSLVQSVPLKDQKWVVIFPAREENSASIFVTTLRQVASQMSIAIGDPVMLKIENDLTQSYIAALKGTLKPDFQLVVFLEPTKKKDRYDELKQLLTTTMPLPSQCICSKTLGKEKALKSVCLKICLQIQAKCGGELWRVDIPLSNTMIVGIDVYHDTKHRDQSILAFTASLNRNFTKYFSVPCFQRSGQEIAESLHGCMRDALKFYLTQNKVLPEKIIIYRDGVGDGQTPAVMKLEIPQIRKVFEGFEKYAPQLVVIVVKKRINARFFGFAGRPVNPTPGTVIDQGVVSRDGYDFYLISQEVNQGSASPTHYHVLVDETNLKPDHLQLLTFKLCHLYYNWSGTVRVPSPCQYAHKMAFLVGQSIHTTPHTRLAGNLYYL